MARKGLKVAELLAAKIDNEQRIKAAHDTFAFAMEILKASGVDVSNAKDEKVAKFATQRDDIVSHAREGIVKIRRQVGAKVAKLASADFDNFLKNDDVRKILSKADV